MSKEFVPYQPSLDMKELGFDERCMGHYWEGLFYYQTTHSHPSTMPNSIESCSAALYQQAFRWFREKYGLDNAILKDRFVIETEEDLPNWYYGFKTYEEVELACLNKLIEIVKNK